MPFISFIAWWLECSGANKYTNCDAASVLTTVIFPSSESLRYCQQLNSFLIFTVFLYNLISSPGLARLTAIDQVLLPCILAILSPFLVNRFFLAQS